MLEGRQTHLSFLARLLSLLFLAATSGPAIGAGPAEPGALPEIELSEQVRTQLRQVHAEKRSRTAAQRKMSTVIVHEIRALKGDPEMIGIPRLEPAAALVASGRLHVDITASVTDSLLSSIRALGGTVESSFAQYDAIRAWVPVAGLESLAARPEVVRIGAAVMPLTNAVNVSQGDVAHRAASARGIAGVTGSGIKVGVLSDSVDFLAAAQATGDLPVVTVLPGQSGSPGSGEGTAMLEIVHDLAPGAQLYFATGFGSEASMANNILQLANQGCKVVVDDVGHLLAPVFQDGLVAQAVDQVAGAGVLYFSSAANSGNLSSLSSGTWEGNFVSGGTFDADTVHSFGSSLTNQLTVSSGNLLSLQWSDAWGASSNDYDLCALSADETQVLQCSTEVQDGAGTPLEFLLPGAPAGVKLIVLNFEGQAAPRFLHLATNRGRLQFATSGETNGHSAAVGALSVAAVNVATAGGGAFVGGGSNPVESFSSDGPRRIFYNATGSPITPGNFLATGGTVRQKPDIAAADGIATTLPPGGLNPFFGTSAAAPHAAAIAALMLDANPAATPAQIRQAFAASSLDIMAPGVDRDSGYGIVDAVEAIDALTSGSGGCLAGPTTACLLNGRFQVDVAWTDFQAVTRAANVAAAGTSDSALFFFGNNVNNWEFLIKAINGCALNNKNWIFFAAATNVGYAVTVTDTQSGGPPKVYNNPVGNLAQAVADINAFSCP